MCTRHLEVASSLKRRPYDAYMNMYHSPLFSISPSSLPPPLLLPLGEALVQDCQACCEDDDDLEAGAGKVRGLNACLFDRDRRVLVH